MRITASPELVARFWSNVDKSGDCWIWTKSLNDDGYGNWCHSGKTDKAYSFAYKLYNDVPDKYQIHHTRRNRACVRPEHLEAVPQSVNLRQSRLCVECGKKLSAG